jgi:hypothetical protein
MVNPSILKADVVTPDILTKSLSINLWDSFVVIVISSWDHVNIEFSFFSTEVLISDISFPFIFSTLAISPSPFVPELSKI